ncbi:DUF2283 domain-containing protein [Rhizobium sp. YIM 134829]|uniref:DUF2283 domain-containing protein n=1 Tax=Rhizobium sp. YIM 134829 TaxID=3390453 RepID=UPI00397D2DD9
MNPIVEYDPSVYAASIRFSSEAVIESAEVAEDIVLDYDEAGRIAGMGVLDATKHLSPSILKVA